MITLNILKLLEDNDFGTVNIDGSETGVDLLWWEKLPVKQHGVFIVSDGDPLARGLRTTQSFTLYSRGKKDSDGYRKLEEILIFFTNDCYPVCDLPTVEEYPGVYKNCSIVPIFNIQNLGTDDTNRIIWSCSAQITYNKEIQ